MDNYIQRTKETKLGRREECLFCNKEIAASAIYIAFVYCRH